MAYDEKLAERVRKVLATREGVAEKKMLGGLAFLLGGRMCCGVLNDDLVVRVGPKRHAAALDRPHARSTDFTGRPLTGFVYVGPRGVRRRSTPRHCRKAGLERSESAERVHDLTK